VGSIAFKSAVYQMIEPPDKSLPCGAEARRRPERTAAGRRSESASPDVVCRDCNRCVPCAGSLRLGCYAVRV
jgi:hypothetical protein